MTKHGQQYVLTKYDLMFVVNEVFKFQKYPFEKETECLETL